MIRSAETVNKLLRKDISRYAQSEKDHVTTADERDTSRNTKEALEDNKIKRM